MFGTEAQTELDDLKVVATKSGGEMKYIARTGEGSRPRQIGDLRAPWLSEPIRPPRLIAFNKNG